MTRSSGCRRHGLRPARRLLRLDRGLRAARPPAGRILRRPFLGEIGALAAAGAIDEGDGLRIVVARGRAMAEAARRGTPGGMLAVGSDRAGAESLSSEHGLVLANENSPSSSSSPALWRESKPRTPPPSRPGSERSAWRSPAPFTPRR